MPHLFVPPSVAQELLDKRAQLIECLKNACSTDRVCDEWNPELQRLDPLLRMVKAPECLVIGVPLVPGYYHIIRDNSNTNAAPTIIPVAGPNGEYVEPGFDLLEQLRGNDLQNARVLAAHRTERMRSVARAEAEKLSKRSARQGELHEKWKAVSRTQVTMNDTVPWSQNHAGERAAKAEASRRDKAAPCGPQRLRIASDPVAPPSPTSPARGSEG